MMKVEDKKNIVRTALERHGNETRLQKKYLTEIANEYGFAKIPYSYLKNYTVGHGTYDIVSMGHDLAVSTESAPADAPAVNETPAAASTTANFNAVETTDSNLQDIVPSKSTMFVKTNEYKTLEKVVKSRRFYPVFVTGMSGNGKSLSVVQAAANAGRELIRINVTQGTDEDDLIGTFQLIDGNVVWSDGPIIEAMKRGAIVLIDEIDMLHPNKAASLFTVLEGNGVYIKKTNRVVNPAPGFNIIATANTKGKGSDDGRFMGTNVLNEAFLERFPITIEYSYPSKKHERKILSNVFASLDIEDEDFTKNLVDWAAIIRKTFEEDAVDELISTRRLVHIAEAYSIFEDKKTAIEMCINRFDDETKDSFLDLYSKLDANMIAADEDGNQVTVAGDENGETPTAETAPF